MSPFVSSPVASSRLPAIRALTAVLLLGACSSEGPIQPGQRVGVQVTSGNGTGSGRVVLEPGSGSFPSSFDINCLVAPGSVSGSCGGGFDDAGGGGSIVLSATADAGSDFAVWTGCDAPASAAPSCTLSFNAGADTSFAVSARFDLEAPPPPPPPASNAITWTGDAGTEDWTDPNNWDLDRVPEDADSVVIGSAAVARFTATDLDSAEVRIRHLALEGELEVRGGGGLTIDEGIAGTAGTLKVHGSVAGVRPFSRVSVGASSELSWLELTGSATFGGAAILPFDQQPLVTAGNIVADSIFGSTSPSLRYVHLVVNGGGLLSDFDSGTSTLEIADQATLVVSGSRLGPAGSPSGRVVVYGQLQADHGAGLRINSAVLNYGSMDATRALVMEYGGLNEGVIVAQDVDQGQITFRAPSLSQTREWELAATSEVYGRRITLDANARVAGLLSGEELQVLGTTHADTIDASVLQVDTLEVTARLWVVGTGTRTLTRTFLSNTGAELWLVDDPAPAMPLVLQTRKLLVGAGTLFGSGRIEADSLQLGPGLAMVLAGDLAVGTYGLFNHGDLVGRGGRLELSGVLDLFPGSSNSISIVTEGPTVGTDLVIVNNGTILKRGLGSALVRACFDAAGTGGVVTEGGAAPITVEALPCN